jgi:hypothetical protein
MLLNNTIKKKKQLVSLRNSSPCDTLLTSLPLLPFCLPLLPALPGWQENPEASQWLQIMVKVP